MALNNYRQTGGGGFSMLRDAPVVYDRQQEIRQLLIDEVRAKGTLTPSDYFHPNWRIVPAGAVGRLLRSIEMSTRMVRVFVNASGVDVPAGSTALDAVRPGIPMLRARSRPDLA